MEPQQPPPEATCRSVGWSITDNVRESCGFHELPREFAQAVRGGKKLLKLILRYERPRADKNSDVTQFHKRGQFTKVPLEERLVPVEDNPWEHLKLAVKLKFPRFDGSKHVGNLYHEVARAVADLDEFHTLGDQREEWMGAFEANFAVLKDMDDHMSACVPVAPEAPEVSRAANLATIGALMECIYEGEYPDVYLVEDLFYGMETCGDGYVEPMVRDTGLFRPVGKNARYSILELSAGKAHATSTKWVDGKWREEADVIPQLSNTAWHHKLKQDLPRAAKAAIADAGLSQAQVQAAARLAATGDEKAIDRLVAGAKNPVAGVRLKMLLLCENMSQKESRTSPPTMAAPKKERQYEAWAEDNGGLGSARPARRHCVQRGFKDDGTPKFRCVDDFRRNGVKQGTTTPETVDLPSFLWPAWMALIIVRAFVKRRLFVPIVTLGLDDMKMAYRMVNASRRNHVTSLVAWFSFVFMCVMVQLAPGHFFGVKAANNNFSRVPRLACHVTAIFFLVAVFHYVDDFMNVDTVWGKRTATKAIALVLRMMGYGVEPSKSKKNGLSHKAIGAVTDLRRVKAEQTVEVSPDMKSVNKMLASLRRQKAAKQCLPSEAETVVGKSRWLTSQLRARAGTAALQPFAQRSQETKTEWVEEMDHSLEFLETVFDPEFLTKLEIQASELTGDDALDNLIMWTDASYHSIKDADGMVISRECLGSVHIYDQRDGKHYVAYDRLPDLYYRHFPTLDQYIGRGEMGFGVAALWSFPLLFMNRKVIHFIDNTQALSNLVNGYSGKPDMARLVNMFHIALLALNVEWYGEWCPSKANIADIMTRPERFHELLEGLQTLPKEIFTEIIQAELRLPPLGDNWTDLKAWMRNVRAHADKAVAERAGQRSAEA